MHEILVKTYELIDELDNSDIIKNINIYREKILNNSVLLDLIRKGNESNDYELIDIKKKLYNYEEYKKYMDSYNELMYIVMDINNRYKKIINERSCIS